MLQTFFNDPLRCYEAAQWPKFTQALSAVTTVLQAVKLDGAAHADGSATVAIDDVYFAKYLTNPKLMELQLADSSFRRQVQRSFSVCVCAQLLALQLLVQCLVLFQYLQAEVKFKKFVVFLFKNSRC